MSFDALYAALGYRFKETAHLNRALTHISHRAAHARDTYERLEFLGDRVLGLVVAQMLYEQFPDEEEGALAKRHAVLVSRETLLKVADALGLEALLRVAASVRQAKRGHFLKADACEAVLAALYLEAGFEEVAQVIRRLWQPHVSAMDMVPENAKSLLQEWAQERGKGLPQYALVARSGPEHAPLFEMEVVLGTKKASAKGASKREAEQKAASDLLKELQK